MSILGNPIVVGGGSGGVSLSDIYVLVGDYTNDTITLTTGSRDKYYRRIYVR